MYFKENFKKWIRERLMEGNTIQNNGGKMISLIIQKKGFVK